MKEELFAENRKTIIGAAVVLLTIAFILLALRLIIGQVMLKNGELIEEKLTGLTYTQEAAVEELEVLSGLTEVYPVTKEVSGKLYRALTEISYMHGDEMLYNRYMAYALYYLAESNDKISYAYLTNKYIGRLYANGCYEAANEMLDNLSDSFPISSLPFSLQVSYYLSRADIAFVRGENNEEYLQLARSAIELMPESGERLLSSAKADILSARGLLNSGKADEAESLMSRYSEDEDFGLGHDQVYVCDFKIPFYELSAKLALIRHSYEEANDYLNCYMQYCDQYNFRAMKLSLIKYFNDEASPEPKISAGEYHALEESVSESNLNDMTDKYGQFLLSDIFMNMEFISSVESGNTQAHRRAVNLMLLTFVLVVFFCVFKVLLSYLNKDGLTRLSNRREYEQMRIHCEKKHIPYCLLMMDIDNFKQINDRFGHERGDEVLRGIAAIIRSYSGRGIFSYRYGGEELCMMLLRVPEARSRAIAEEIRNRIEKDISREDMHVTVSIGLCCSENGENIFRQADIKLYDAKEKGKNMVC